jgi:hypothetical protein
MASVGRLVWPVCGPDRWALAGPTTVTNGWDSVRAPCRVVRAQQRWQQPPDP